jgi:hypothetical protein
MIPLSSLAGMIDTAPTEERARMPAADYARLKSMTPRELAVAGKVVERLMAQEASEDVVAALPRWQRRIVVEQYAISVMLESGWEAIRNEGWRKSDRAKPTGRPRGLSPEQIRAIRDPAIGTARQAAAVFDISVDLAYRIRRREIYADVADDPPGQ